MSDQLHAKIYVGAEREIAESVLRNNLVMSVRDHTADCGVADIDVRRNEDRNDHRFAATIDGFVYAPTYLDVFGKPESSPESVVRAVSEILTSLWSAKVIAVAAADFEEDLPHRGGVGLFK